MTTAIALDSIRAALDSADAEERRQATARLSQVELAGAVPLLVRSLGDEDWRVRKEATIAARTFAADRPLIDALIDELRTGDNVGLRNAAVDVLASAGPAATAPLRKALGELDADGRKLAVEALGRAGDPSALGALEGAFAVDPDDNVRGAAVEAIARLGAIAPTRVQEILLGSLEDRDRLVRLAALEGLSAMEVVIPWERLSPLIDDPILRSVALSAAALSQRPEAALALTRALVSAWSDAPASSSPRTAPRGGAFSHALSALGRLAEGPLAPHVGEALRAEGGDLARRLVALGADRAESLERRALSLRLAAVARAPGAVEGAFAALSEEALAETARQALRSLDGPAIPAMLGLLADAAAPAAARAELVDVVAELGSELSLSQVTDVLPALRTAARDPERIVAARALAALSRLGTAADLELAAAQTHDASRAIAMGAEAALWTLAGRFPEEAREQLTRLSADEPSQLAVAVILGALAALGADLPEDASFLAQVASSGGTRARRAAVLAVSEMGGAIAMEVLSFALADEERDVQLAAARALGRRCVVLSSPSASEILDLVARSGAAELVAVTVRAVGEGLSLAHTGRRSVPPAPPPPELISALSLFARGAPSPVAMAAVDALGQAIAAGTSAACDALAAALEHSDGPVAKSAAFKLSETALGLDALARRLDHPSPAVRTLVVEVLAEADLAGVRDALTRRSLTETDRDVRAALERALSPASRAHEGLRLFGEEER